MGGKIIYDGENLPAVKKRRRRKKKLSALEMQGKALSKVEICNLALDAIKASTIEDLDENSVSAEKCRRLYHQALRSTLQSSDWDFARTQKALELISDVEVAGWNYCYKLPNLCIQPLSIYYDPETEDKPVYEKMYCERYKTQMLVANKEKVILTYTCYIDDPTQYSELFIDALIQRLAMSLIKPLNGTLNDISVYGALLKESINDADAKSAQSKPTTIKRKNRLIEARH